MKHRILARLSRAAPRWPLFAPLVALGTECLLQVRHPFVLYHYWVAFRDQPLRSVAELSLSVARLYAACLLLAAAADLGARFLARLIPPLRSAAVRFALFFCLYALGARETFLLKPAISGAYWTYYPKWLFLAGAVGFALALWRYRALGVAWPARHAWTAIAVAIAILVSPLSPLERPAARPAPSAPSRPAPAPQLPSFLVMGIDGVPADVFDYQSGGNRVAPLWHGRWSRDSVRFPNAYSVTNSTYTSWFSVLSGRYPHESKVQTLYPSDRDGALAPEELLPNRLRALGYRTLYFSDCGATSYMRPEFGFESLDQAGLGIFECGRAVVLSLHPSTFLLSPFGLFPERSTFCSATYQPELFFSKIERTLEALDRDRRPYLLAFHSCLTHQQLFSHGPPIGSPLREALPSRPAPFSQRLRNLELSIRYADAFLSRLLEKRERLQRKPWTFLISDHGLRIDRVGSDLKGFTHGVGDPVNRYQYRVPFAVFPGDGAPLVRGGRVEPALASLIDLYPTITELAGQPAVTSAGRSLLPSLRGERASERSLLLSSSIPVHLSADNHELIDVFLENRIDDHGHHYFPRELEARLLKNAPVALLRWPHRLVVQTGRAPRLFREDLDPFNSQDIAGSVPSVTKEMAEELCRRFPEAWCRTPAAARFISKRNGERRLVRPAGE